MAIKAKPRTSWIKQAFMLPPNGARSELERIHKTYTIADGAYTDTSIGGSWEINPQPQFTRFADLPRMPTFTKFSNTSIGGSRGNVYDSMGGGKGRVYEEHYSQNARRIHIRAGVAKFNSLTRYFGNFVNLKQATAARTGRLDKSLLQTIIGGATGLLTLPLAPIVFLGRVVRYWTGSPSTKYYYLKPTMETFWMTYSNMVNGVWAGMGVTDMAFAAERGPLSAENDVAQGTEWGILKTLFPDVYGGKGYIDMNSISSRAERLRMVFQAKVDDKMKNMTGEEASTFLFNLRSRDPSRRGIQITDSEISPADATFQDYLNAYADTEFGKWDPSEGDPPLVEASDAVEVEEADAELRELQKAYADHYTAKLRDASEFITFRVDDIGTVTESFSNSTKESSIQGAINSMSATARDRRFDFADGNIAGPIGSIVEFAKDVVMEVADTLQLTGIAALAGSAFADIPEQWDDSSADAGTMTFNIQLRAPYNNPISRLQNIIIPMCGWLSLALPLSTGQQSFTSPYLLEIYSVGQGNHKLCIIDSLTISRAQGDVKWNNRGEYMGVDISVSVKSLSNVIHMPIAVNSGIFSTAAMAAGSMLGAEELVANALAVTSSETYNSDSMYNDYLGTLASLPFEDMIHKSAMWNINMRRTALSYMRVASDSWWPSIASNNVTGQILNMFSERTGRQ